MRVYFWGTTVFQEHPSTPSIPWLLPIPWMFGCRSILEWTDPRTINYWFGVPRLPPEASPPLTDGTNLKSLIQTSVRYLTKSGSSKRRYQTWWLWYTVLRCIAVSQWQDPQAAPLCHINYDTALLRRAVYPKHSFLIYSQ